MAVQRYGDPFGLDIAFGDPILGEPNSRVKDLPDLALLALTGPLDAERVRQALRRTFEFRATHPVPEALPDPPGYWDQPYLRLAQENELKWRGLAEVTEVARRFLDPVLNGAAAGRWCPESWTWGEGGAR
jgi:hypothetical protein